MSLITHCGARQLDREALRALPVPATTDTFKPIPHIEVVERLIETLSYRHIGVVREQYAVSDNGLRIFGVLDLESSIADARFSIGLRNGNDRQVRLALTVGIHVFVCDNLSFHGDYTPVLAKHSKNFNLADSLAIGVDRMQRNFSVMQEQVAAWQRSQITDTEAKTIIYDAFIGGQLDVPRHLAREVHKNYFEPPHKEFEGRTLWSLQNAFTESFKVIDGASFFQATAKLGKFFTGREQAEIVSNQVVEREPKAYLAPVEATVADVMEVFD